MNENEPAHRTTSRRAAPASISVLVAVLILILSVAGPTLQSKAGSSRFTYFTTAPCSSIEDNATINEEVNNFYNESGLVWSTSGWTSVATVSGNVIAMMQTVCGYSSFQTLIANWGADNFSLEFYVNSGGYGVDSANYTMTWQAWAGAVLTEYVEWWHGNVSTLAISAASTDSAPATLHNSGSLTSANWGGWEWWVSSGGSIQALGSESATTTRVTFSNPACCQTNVPSGTVIDPAAAVWTGLAPGPGGTSLGTTWSLLQTGYVIDTATPSANWCIAGTNVVKGCNYGLWWELLPGPAYAYSGHPHAKASDVLVESVYKSAVGKYRWTTKIDDLTRTKTWTHSVVLKPSGDPAIPWTPFYATFIVEAPNLQVPPSPGPHLQQIAKFGTVSFDGGSVTTLSTAVSYGVQTLYGSSTYNVYTMSQSPSVSNTAESFTAPCGSYASCADVTWQSSQFRYV